MKQTHPIAGKAAPKNRIELGNPGVERLEPRLARTESLGASGDLNVQGEQQQKLDADARPTSNASAARGARVPVSAVPRGVPAGGG